MKRYNIIGIARKNDELVVLYDRDGHAYKYDPATDTHSYVLGCVPEDVVEAYKADDYEVATDKATMIDWLTDAGYEVEYYPEGLKIPLYFGGTDPDTLWFSDDGEAVIF